MSSSRAFWALSPMLAVVLVALVLPFAWRTAEMTLACAQGPCVLWQTWEDGFYLEAMLRTVLLSAISTLLGLAIGLGVVLHLTQRPGWERTVAVVAGLSANFAGVPLATALTLLLGSQGVLTVMARQWGLMESWNLQTDLGLLLAYTCFQVPLAVLLLMAPVRLLDPALSEAASTLGASKGLYWKRVGLPLLAPSLVEAASLLFANAAAAYATPFALAGTDSPVLAVRIASAVSGDIFAQPELATALSLNMALLLLASIWSGRALSARLREVT